MDDKDQESVTYISGDDSITLDISDYGAAQATMDYTTVGGTIDTIDLGSFTIGSSSLASGNFGNGMSWTTSGNTQFGHSGKYTISTPNNIIDIDELAELVKVLKERLLVIVPNFEMHEKYPMLKEMYDEYKAMEQLLSGPDRGLDDNE